MTLAQVAVPAAIRRQGAAPAGVNPAQLAAWRRLQAASSIVAALEPLDPDYLADERAWEQWRRRNGD